MTRMVTMACFQTTLSVGWGLHEGVMLAVMPASRFLVGPEKGLFAPLGGAGAEHGHRHGGGPEKGLCSDPDHGP